MDKAYSVTLRGRPIGAATAAEKLAEGAIPDIHDFLCADDRCREVGVRVFLAAADEDDQTLPHFRTCTRKQTCLIAMGYPPDAKPNADDMHVDGCEAYEPKASGAKAGRYERTVGDMTVLLQSGTPIVVRRIRPVSDRPVGPVIPTPLGGHRAENQHAKLYGLVDSLKGWDKASLADRRVVIGGEERTIADLFVDATVLDYLSFDRYRRPIRRVGTGQDQDWTERVHIFFGPASARTTANGAVRIAFEGGIDLAFAFAQPVVRSSNVGLSLFVDENLLNVSRNKRMFGDDLEALDINESRATRCFAFVLGQCRPLTPTGYFNVKPLGTAEDVVVLRSGESYNFTHLLDHVRDALSRTEHDRGERLRQASQRPEQARLEAKGSAQSSMLGDVSLQFRRPAIELPEASLRLSASAPSKARIDSSVATPLAHRATPFAQTITTIARRFLEWLGVRDS